MAGVQWIKINTNMFDNRKIRHIRKLPEGNNIVLIWVMLLTMAGRCNASGMIFLTENIPYTSKMLANELDFEENTVILALEALEQLGMIARENSMFYIPGWEEHQNAEALEKIKEQNNIRKKRQRERQKLLQCHGNVTEMSRDLGVTQAGHPRECHATEEEKEIEKEKNKNNSVRETTHTIFKRLLPTYSISDTVVAKMDDWIKYKTERKEPYKEQGMKSLLTQVEKKAMKYGDEAVCNLIDECMASNWRGIIFDRLENKKTTYTAREDAIANRVSMVDDW